MINCDEYINKNKIGHNPNWPYIPDHPYRISIIGGSGSGKTNTLLNLIDNQLDINKIYLYAKDPYEDKYQFLINKRESIGLKHFKDPRAFVEYSNDMHDVYKDINDYNPDKENKILIVFDDVYVIHQKLILKILLRLIINAQINHIHFSLMIPRFH